MGEDDVEKDIKKAMAGTSPAAAPVPTSAPTDSVEADIQKAMRPSAGQGEQVANPYYEIGKKKPSEIDDVDRDIISTAKTPDQIKQIPKHLPLTEDQLRTKFEHERSLPWNEGMKTPEDWYNIGKDIVGSGVSFVKGAKKFAENTFFSGADEDPSGWGNLSAQPLKDVVSTAVQLPEDVAYAATKLNEGGMGWTDRLSEKLGFHDKEKSYENYKARHLVDQVHAQAEMENPSIYGRIMKGDIANAALSAVVLNSLPDLQTIMEQDGLSLDQAKAKRKAMADQIAQQTTSEIAAQEKPADEDIRTLGQFALPSGLGLGEMGVLGLGAEAAGGLSQQIAKGLKYIGKTDDEIKAMNDAAQALQRSKQVEKIQRAQQPTLAGRAAGTLASGVEKLQQAAENAPQILKTIAPYAIGGALGYETDQQNPLLGAFIGAGIGHGAVPVFKAAANIAKIPALIRDIDEARALSAGGTRGTFETLGSFPDVSEQTAKILRFGGKRLDNIINNSVDYAKSGIHPTLLAVATGALDSADPEQMNQLVSQGLLYGLGGRAVHQAWGKIGGVDPIAEQRERRAQAVDDFKTYQNLDPESQKTLTGLTSWDNVVERHEGRLLDAQNAYSEAVRTGSADAQKLGQDVIAQKNVLSAVKRANVQTRNEFGRQFLTQLTRLNELTNGTLRAGQNNVGIHILAPDQIFAKFRQDPANNGMSDADIMETANQQGFYSTPEGAVEYQAGMPMGGVKKTLIFDRTKPSIVINANHLKARQQIFGETPTEALTHEFGHHIRNIPEFKEANKEAEDLLFSQEIKDLTGKVVTTTSGQYSQKALVDMYTNNYMKGKTPDQIEQLSKLAGLWDASRGQLDEQAVANYMRDEIVAELNADTLSSHLGTDLDSGSLRMLDVARLKTKKNLLDRAVQKFFGNGGKGDPVSELTGATFSPEVVAANRQAMRALQALQGEVSPAVKAPDAPKISRAMMMKNRALQEVYGKYSGLFKTEMVGQMFDAAGNPVGGQVKITNPSASEGVWAEDRQMSGYGQKPDELSTAPIPAGGRLVVSKEIVRQPDGVTPVMYSPSELKKLQIARKDTIMQALDTPDHGTPNRFQPVSDGSQTWRGTFTPLQIEAIKNLPESIVSRSIKEHILKIHDALQRGDGSRMIVDYAAVMNDAGKYTAYSPKHYDVVPIGMHLSKDGHFLVTTISVGRLFDKLNAWSQRMPARLAPWKGDKDAFFKEFTEKYLKNWQYREKDAQGNEIYPQGRAGEYGLSGTPEEALAKKKIFNDFLNLTTNEFRDRNDDRTTTPRRRGDVRGKDIDRTIMSMRLDHIADLIDNEYAPKVPVNYGNAIKNFMPAEEAVIEPQEERDTSSIYYHGTTRNEGEEGKLNSLGLIFVSPDKKEASMYSQARGGRVLETDITGKNIFDAENQEDLSAIGATDEDRLWDSRYIENEKWVKKIKDAGYDGFNVQDVSVGGIYGVTRGAKNIALFETPKFAPAQEERRPTAIDLGITAAHSPESRPFSAQYVAPTAKYPTSEQGFYSGLQKVVDEKMPAKASPQQILSIVNNPQNAKADEVKWSNLAGFVEGKDSVTKQEVLDYLRNEGSVKFEERTLSKPNVGPWGVSNYLGDRPTEPKYSQYVLPNGENYREVVLTMPENAKQDEMLSVVSEGDKITIRGKEMDWKDAATEYIGGGEAIGLIKTLSRFTPEQRANYIHSELVPDIRVKLGALKSTTPYTSSHFQDIPNYVAHMRLDERKDASGKDGLFIEEIQSDRHQKGRDQGYRGDESAMKELQKKQDDYEQTLIARYKTDAWRKEATTLEKDYWDELSQKIRDGEAGVADAPFRKDWSVQMFKRALRDAIDSGKEWIGWTSGDTQVDRFDLSKSVQAISYRQKDGELQARGTDGGRAISKSGVTPEKLESFVGKEAAQKLLDQPTGQHFSGQDGLGMGWHSLSGESLKVGGQGMKGFYDQILPKEIGKYVKKWGAKVEEGDVKTDPNEYDTTPIWKVSITPEMRDSIQKGGQIQFMPSRDGEEERITAATYTNPRTGKVSEGATHLIANPSAPQEATDRESPAYGFKTSSGGIVDRATAYQIAKDSGQLKAPTTEEEKFHADRGILHSGMYEPKGGISFMPASKLDEAYDAAVKAGDEAYDPTKENGGVDGLRVKIKEFAESLPDPKSDEIKFHYEKDGIYGLVDNFFRKAFEMLDAKYDEHRASTGSTYIHISIPKAEGDTLENTQELDRENHKITIRDHDVSVFRAREFGSPTKTIKVDNFDTKENVLSAATRLSEHLSNIIEPYREYLSEKANPNAARDEAYDAAVKAGDMEEAQRLVDEAAKEAGNWIPAYHVSQSTDIKVPSGNRGVAAHVTFSKTLADQLSVRDGENPKIYNWYVKGDIFDPENPNHIKRLEDAESNWPLTAPYPEQIQHSGTWKQLENPALQSIIKKAGFDGYYDRSNVGSSWKDSAAIFDANNIKSADPATYDNEGKLIPLSQRFDPTKSDIRFMPADNEPEINKEGHVFPRDISKPFPFTKNVAINFMPATAKVDLEDYADYPIIALTADRMGIGQAFVGPEGAKQPLSIPRQGGAGFSTLYTDEDHNPVWGFSDEATANRFQKRVDEVAEQAGTSSVLVAPTLLSSDNHLHNLTGQMAYSEAIDAALKSGLVNQSTINDHVQEIANRIANSKNAKQPQAMRDKFGKIKTYADLKKAITDGSLNFADAAWLKEKAGMRTLPIKAEEMQRLGILPSVVAQDLVHEGFYHLPNFSVVSLFEVPAGQKAEKGDYHKSYPYIVRGKAIGYLKNIYNLANLTSDPKVRTKSGEITAQPVMVVMPKLDPVLVKNALSTLKAYTPQSK